MKSLAPNSPHNNLWRSVAVFYVHGATCTSSAYYFVIVTLGEFCEGRIVEKKIWENGLIILATFGEL